ncbi:MAG: alanine racemase [Bacteroidales bacterium]|nr:alanine racemase [Bacteroidales bacterium]
MTTLSIPISLPTLIIDRAIATANIGRMLAKARVAGAVLRPHFKTHQSPEVGRWFRKEGVDRIAVSSVSMAKEFAANGWKDIMIAFPVNLREMDEINGLAAHLHLGLVVSAPGVMPALAELLRAPADVYLKIDVGTHRTGFDPHELDAIKQALEQSATNPMITIAGLVAHAGHTYHAKSPNEILAIQKDAMAILNGLKKVLSQKFPRLLISWGDTPSCSLASEFYGAGELRPGNFVYYDLMQWQLGVCRQEDIAAVMAAPVVALHPERNEMVVYGGAVHLSKEQSLCPEGKPHYGLLVLLDNSGKWSFPEKPCYVRRISQEHGVISLPAEMMKQFKPGNLVGIVPVHSCLTADLLKNETIFI